MQNVWILTVHTFVVVKLASTGMERHVKVSNHNSNGERFFVYCFVILSSFFMSSICYFLDIDECLNNPCHHNASCTDNEGSFHCQCNVGFSGDGVNCTSKGCFLTSGFLVFTLFWHSSQCFTFIISRHWRMFKQPMPSQCQLHRQRRFFRLSMPCWVFWRWSKLYK